jgi:3-oxoacyl-[acyl-carrier protein] reductase
MAVSNGLRPGLGMLAKALSDELGTRGIRVNGLMPAWIATARAVELSAAGHDNPVNSLRRRGTAEEFGRVATFLLSPAASYVTGAMIAVEGGALPTI